jgi:hypothetical protein
MTRRWLRSICLCNSSLSAVSMPATKTPAGRNSAPNSPRRNTSHLYRTSLSTLAAFQSDQLLHRSNSNCGFPKCRFASRSQAVTTHDLFKFRQIVSSIIGRKVAPDASYPRYEVIRERFEKHFMAFARILGTHGLGAPKIDQCEVSYINQIPATEDNGGFYFEPVPPRLARNTIIESTFEVGRRFRCTMRIDCGQLDAGAVIRPDPGEWHPRMPARLDEEELADWQAGRNAVY